MLNVVYYSFSNATKGTFTTQEVAPKTSEVAPKGDEVTLKHAVEPSDGAVKNVATTQENATTTQESIGTTQENAAKNAVTTQESTGTTQEVAPKSGEVAPKVAPKSSGVAPKSSEVAPKTSEVAPKKEGQEICKIVESVFPMLRDGIAEKCAKMYFYMKGSGGSNSAMARELGIPLRSIIRYQEILKQAHVLEHVGPTNGGTWKFLI